MSKYRFLLIIPFIAVMLLAWYIIGSNDGTRIKSQRELLSQAAAYAEDKVYVKAVPLVVEAYNIDTDIRYTEIEPVLMEYYLAGDYRDEYFSMVNARIEGDRAEREEYLALAEYFFNEGEASSGLAVLEKAIVKYDGDKLPDWYGIAGLKGTFEGELYSDEFTALYEEHRLAYTIASFSFAELGAVGKSYMTVRDEESGLWGFYSASGKKLTDFIYTEATNVSSGGYATVKLGDEYLLVDSKGVRYALCKDERVTEVVRTEGENRSIVRCSDGLMYRADDMVLSEKGYDYYGAQSEGYRAMCKDGKWYFAGEDAPEITCDDIKVNSADEAVISGRAFIKQGGAYKMIALDGTVYDTAFEDAKPFCSGGQLAAVKMNGKWGFADRNGNIVIDCLYEEAESFCSEGAGIVKCDDGYFRFIDLRGSLIDKYEFFAAREFIGTGSAVRLTEDNWSIITVS